MTNTDLSVNERITYKRGWLYHIPLYVDPRNKLMLKSMTKYVSELYLFTYYEMSTLIDYNPDNKKIEFGDTIIYDKKRISEKFDIMIFKPQMTKIKDSKYGEYVTYPKDIPNYTKNAIIYYAFRDMLSTYSKYFNYLCKNVKRNTKETLREFLTAPVPLQYRTDGANKQYRHFYLNNPYIPFHPRYSMLYDLIHSNEKNIEFSGGHYHFELPKSGLECYITDKLGIEIIKDIKNKIYETPGNYTLKSWHISINNKNAAKLTFYMIFANQYFNQLIFTDEGNNKLNSIRKQMIDNHPEKYGRYKTIDGFIKAESAPFPTMVYTTSVNYSKLTGKHLIEYKKNMAYRNKLEEKKYEN